MLYETALFIWVQFSDNYPSQNMSGFGALTKAGGYHEERLSVCSQIVFNQSDLEELVICLSSPLPDNMRKVWVHNHRGGVFGTILAQASTLGS